MIIVIETAFFDLIFSGFYAILACKKVGAEKNGFRLWEGTPAWACTSEKWTANGCRGCSSSCWRDILGILGSYLLALWARFDFHFMDIPPEFLQGYLSTIWWWVLICLAVFWLCNLYNSIWRFVSVDALMRIILAYVILGGLSFGCVKLFHIVMPRSYYVWGLLCSSFITAGIRFFYRGVRYLRNRVPGSQKGTENVMIIGAGQAGRQLIREYAVSSHLNSRVACLIDDNPAKHGRILEGVRIVGGRRDIPQAVKRYDIRKIIFAIPSLQGAGR